MPVFQLEDQWLLGDEDVEHFDHLSEHPLACAPQPRILLVPEKVREMKILACRHKVYLAELHKNLTKTLDLL